MILTIFYMWFISLICIGIPALVGSWFQNYLITGLLTFIATWLWLIMKD